MAAKTSKLPFEQLPNLPPPVIPIVELRAEPIKWDLVQREDVEVADKRYLGQYYVDQSCQTNESELGEVKQVAQVLDELSEVRVVCFYIIKIMYARVSTQNLLLYVICKDGVGLYIRRG